MHALAGTPLGVSKPPIVQTLWLQFTSRGRIKIDSLLGQERYDETQDKVYARVLKALSRIAPSEASVLIEWLHDWRNGFERQSSAVGTSAKKKLAVEVVFLEALVKVVGGSGVRLTAQQFQRLEDTCIDWVMRPNEYVERNPELKRLQEQVTHLSSQLLGVLSELDLKRIKDRFLKELTARLPKDNPEERKQLLSLCHGMKSIRLGFRDSAQLEISRMFLRDTSPMRHVAPIRKSQVQHTICEMLSSIIKPYVEHDIPRHDMYLYDAQSVESWFTTVELIRQEITKWNKSHAKHGAVGYPLITQLTCLLDDDTFLTLVDQEKGGSYVDTLHKQLKDKNMRTLVLDCLQQLIHTYCQRFAPPAVPQVGVSPYRPLNNDRVNSWLDKTTRPLMAYMRKGMFPLQEQQEIVMSMCVMVCQHVPEFAIAKMVVELMSVEGGSYECQVQGLRALRKILVTAPAHHTGKLKSSTEGGAGGVHSSESESNFDSLVDREELMDMIRRGTTAFDMYGIKRLELQVSRALSAILLNCHQNFGHHRMTTTNRVVDVVAKEKLPGLTVLSAALCCVPYILPEHWRGSKFAEDLAWYTIHADHNVRSVAFDVLRRALRSYPDQRELILHGMCSMVSAIADEHDNVIADSVVHVDQLMQDWMQLLSEHDSDTSAKYMDPLSPGSRRLDAHRIEGMAVALLCHTDMKVRIAGERILHSVRLLHSALLCAHLPSMPSIPTTPASTATFSEATGTDAGPVHLARVIDDEPTYLIDIIQQAGPELLSNCYWDFGRWSDLWRLYKPVEEIDGLTLKTLLVRRNSFEESVRCARVLSEVVRHAGQLCRPASHWAYVEICNRMKGANVLIDEGGGRYSIPADLPDHRKELVTVYACVAVAANLMPNRRDYPVSMLDMCRALVNAIRNGSEWQNNMAQLALGHCNAVHYDKVLQELQDVVREYSGPGLSKASKGRPRKEDLRIAVGHILRQIADVLPPGKLKTASNLRNELTKFLKSTADYVMDPMNKDEVSSDLLQLKYCLCGVSKCVGLQLGRAMPTMFGTDLRHTLFDMFASYCKEGYLAVYMRSKDVGDKKLEELYRADIRERITAARNKLKDGEAAKNHEAELVECSEMLDHAAGQAMAAMLMGPLLDNKFRTKDGKAFMWIDRMMKVSNDLSLNSEAGRCGPCKHDVAVRALTYFLESNQDVFQVVLDQCYSHHPAVANGYFQVLVEVYALHDIQVRTHMLLSLVLYKLVDESRDVRADALQLLNVLSQREWHQDSGVVQQGDEDAKVAVVIGGVQDSYQQFQYHLSAKLARDHPELSEALCVEMMTRQLDVPSLKHHVLTCLIPWIENLSFAPKWEGNWSGRMLQAMYYVTLQHGAAFPYEIERLWSTVASNKRNIIPIVDFLIAKGLEECHLQVKPQMLQYFSVSKRIGLYLARMSPQQTIDHMAYEITQLFLATDENLPGPGTLDLDHMPFKPVEFHHALTTPQHAMTRSQSMPSAMSIGISPLNTTSSRQYNRTSASTPGAIRKGVELMRHMGMSMSRSESGSSRYSPSFVSAPDQSVTPVSVRIPESGYSPNLSRHGSSEDIHMDSDKARPMSRPELALCLLAEIAYEHDEDLRSHLPLLCQTAVMLMDSDEPVLYHHCQHALIHLLYSLSARHLEIHHATGALLSEYRQVSRLIKYLQSMAGRRLWVYEDATLGNPRVASCRALESLVQELVGSVFFESDLKERWRDEALRWMIEGSHQHLACRSHQVYRALRPAMTLRCVSALLSGLHKCLAHPTHRTMEVAIEILLTLQCLVDNTDSSKLLLYPQLFLVCMPLMTFSYVHIFTLTLELFSKMLKHLDLNNITVQNVLLVSCPAPRPHDEDEAAKEVEEGDSAAAWVIGKQLFGPRPAGVPGGKLWAVQQLLMKGMFRSESELLTVQALIQVAQHVANAQLGVSRQPSFLTNLSLVEGMGNNISGIGATIGNPELQVVLTLWGLLPWLCIRTQQHSRLAKVCVKVLRYACAAIGFTEVAHSLADFHSEDDNQLASSVSHLCAAICKATFPKYAKLALQRLMDTLQRGLPSYGAAVLLITHCVLHSPGVNLGGVLYEEPFVLAPVAALMDGPLGPQALEVLEGVLHYTSLHSDVVPSDAANGGQYYDWPRCSMNDAREANKMAVAVFGRIIEGYMATKSQRSVRIMPFVVSPPESRKASQAMGDS